MSAVEIDSDNDAIGRAPTYTPTTTANGFAAVCEPIWHVCIVIITLTRGPSCLSRSLPVFARLAIDDRTSDGDLRSVAPRPTEIIDRWRRVRRGSCRHGSQINDGPGGRERHSAEDIGRPTTASGRVSRRKVSKNRDRTDRGPR